jgi:hypothetical protein
LLAQFFAIIVWFEDPYIFKAHSCHHLSPL